MSPKPTRLHIKDAAATGQRVREARRHAGLTLRQLAFPGCTAAYLSRIESGDRAPSLQLLREIARRLGVSAEYLASGAVPGLELELEAELALRMDEVELAGQLYARALADAADARSRAHALEGLGRLAYRSGDPSTAVTQLEEALELLGTEALARGSLGDTLGRAYATVGELESAIAVYERYLAAAREREDLAETVRFSVLLATALADAANYGRAEELLAAVLTQEELLDPMARVRLHSAQCRLHILRQEPDVAERYAWRVLAQLQLSDDAFYLARAHRLMAHVQLDRDDPTAALDFLERGERILGQSGNAHERASFQLTEAEALARLGERERAYQLASSASATLADSNATEAGGAYLVIADSFAQAGEHERALELYELACEILERRPSRYLVEAYTKLGNLLEQQGRQDEALTVFKKGLAVQAHVARPAHD